jgi:hypothetical protein
MLVIIVSVSAVLLLIGMVIFRSIPTSPLIISKETTYITGPLTADGQINYFKALEERIYPPELATDDNGYRIFYRLFGGIKNDGLGGDEFVHRQMCEKLGLDSDVSPTLVLPQPPDEVLKEFYKAKGEEYAGKNKWDRPWTLEEYPMLADWIREIDETMDAFAAALRKPVFVVPLLKSRDSVSLGDPLTLIASDAHRGFFFQNMAHVFKARANFRVAQSNIDGAIADTLTLYRLGRHLAQKNSLFQYNLGNAIEHMAATIPINADPDHPLTKEQIQCMLAGLNTLPPRAPIADAYEWQRFQGLLTLQRTISDGSGEMSELLKDHLPQWFINKSRFDWNLVYRRTNELYDAMQEPLPKEKYHEMLEAINTTTETRRDSLWRKFVTLLTPRGKEHALADALFLLYHPSVNRFEERVHQTECAENMQRLVLAMLLYQCEHGKLPDENGMEQIKPYLGENVERSMPQDIDQAELFRLLDRE